MASSGRIPPRVTIAPPPTTRSALRLRLPPCRTIGQTTCWAVCHWHNRHRRFRRIRRPGHRRKQPLTCRSSPDHSTRRPLPSRNWHRPGSLGQVLAAAPMPASMPQPAVAPQAAAGGDNALIAAFLRGVGLPAPAAVEEPETLMVQAGEMVRAMVSGPASRPYRPLRGQERVPHRAHHDQRPQQQPAQIFRR